MKKRADGRYVTNMMIDGKRVYFYGKSRAEVNNKIRDYQARKEQGPLFRDVAEEWWEAASPLLAHNSLKNYKPAYERAKSNFVDSFISGIVPADINQVIARFSRTAADKTTRTQLMIYNLIFKYAVNQGYIMFNPARDVSVPKNLPKRKVSMPSDEDIKRIKESTDCTFGLFAYMALYTGLRRAELLALEWKDINFEKRIITVNKALEYVGSVPNIKEPKTRSGYRTVPITDKLLPKLHKGNGLVFPNSEGSYITESQFIMLWDKYKEESGVSCTPHQLRHAFATMLYENDIEGKDAQYILGHAQLSTTMDIYTDIREQRARRIGEKARSLDI